MKLNEVKCEIRDKIRKSLTKVGKVYTKVGKVNTKAEKSIQMSQR